METKTVIAREAVGYICNCPNCNETICSEYQDDWDVWENIHYTIAIACPRCEKAFCVKTLLTAEFNTTKPGNDFITIHDTERLSEKPFRTQKRRLTAQCYLRIFFIVLIAFVVYVLRWLWLL